MEQRSIAFIGAGNMARAIIAGLIASGYAADKIIATAPSLTRREPLKRNTVFAPPAITLLRRNKRMWWC